MGESMAGTNALPSLTPSSGTSSATSKPISTYGSCTVNAVSSIQAGIPQTAVGQRIHGTI